MFISWKAKLQDLDQAKQESHIVSMAKNLFKRGKLSKNIMNNLKYINE